MSQHQEKVSVGFAARPFLLLASGCDLTLSLCRVDVVICLSTTVRNDTLQDAKEQRVSLKCRKQLRVEELEMVANNKLCLSSIAGWTFVFLVSQHQSSANR